MHFINHKEKFGRNIWRRNLALYIRMQQGSPGIKVDPTKFRARAWCNTNAASALSSFPLMTR